MDRYLHPRLQQGGDSTRSQPHGTTRFCPARTARALRPALTQTLHLRNARHRSNSGCALTLANTDSAAVSLRSAAIESSVSSGRVPSRGRWLGCHPATPELRRIWRMS